jgi:long-chain acyl-CoA synthetase
MEYRIAEDGEILLRGPSVFLRYHRNPRATMESFDQEGWFRTGDVGTIKDGFLQIVDRKKDILVTTNGKNIAPQKLENLLKAHSPYVGQAVVFGDNRPYCVVLITPSEPAVRDFGSGDIEKAATSSALNRVVGQAIEEINTTLPSHERLKRHIIVPMDFSESTGELTPSLKVKRAVVAERHRDQIAYLYEK